MNNNFNLFTQNYKGLLAILKIFKEEYPQKQLGKTMIQKLCFMLTRENILDYDYSLYHYGPFSPEVESDLDILDFFDDVNIKWNKNGYDIKIEKEDIEIKKEDSEKIREIVKEYGDYTATDMSLIATALFLKDNTDIENDDLVSEVQNIKPNFEEEYIEEILKQAKIIS